MSWRIPEQTASPMLEHCSVCACVFIFSCHITTGIMIVIQNISWDSEISWDQMKFSQVPSALTRQSLIPRQCLALQSLFLSWNFPVKVSTVSSDLVNNYFCIGTNKRLAIKYSVWSLSFSALNDLSDINNLWSWGFVLTPKNLAPS